MAPFSSAINSSPEDRSVGCHLWVVGEVAGGSSASSGAGSSNELVRDCCCLWLFWIFVFPLGVVSEACGVVGLVLLGVVLVGGWGLGGAD